MTITLTLQIASTFFGLCSAALWGYSGYSALSYDQFKRREERRAKRENRQPNLGAAVYQGKVLGSGRSEFLNAIGALFAALAVLSGAALAWTQPACPCPAEQSSSATG
ncbi:hypothetical protein GS397_10285 [Sphingobium yanoikuyae]|uniref:Uncharacterized protein n=1 Tax=Sphingobium yanoikuyae TaxID=13690 RepID=A0A6P1GG92_SPHYA|nr:hypothetical protein [Sphingobium yanoikuyae]QHD67400.1 hypothetical protein GS397_10285 [Sphingobium yanoikuyae]